MVLDADNKTFVIHMAIKNQKEILVYLKKLAKIEAKIRALLFDKALIKVLAKYLNYNNIFLAKNITKLSEHLKINNYIIELKKDKQLFFDSI